MTLRTWLATALLLAGGWAGAATRSIELVQPAESPNGLILVTAPDRAYVEDADGRRQRVPLRRDERLTEIADTRSGWVVAGVKDTGVHQRLVVLTQESGAVRRLPPPPGQTELLRLRPILLIHRDRLAGMAWLAGDDFRTLAVFAADWDGAAWSPPVRVVPAEPGNQTGLTGLVLADGSWLLVWSQFDGNDDEIFWSLRRGAAWGDARQLDLDIRVPDITPHLVRQSGGALLAWSRYDGNGYRTLLARFAAGRWHAPEPVGRSGSIDPRFSRRGGTTYLIYRTAWPPNWTVARLAAGGRRLESRAVFPEAPPEWPALQEVGTQGVTLTWPTIRSGIEAPWERLP